ncbi:neck protein [Vibrio phage 1.101.O._10N.261.45.C6]|nr:neck protein [Vibrio phage 1.101.O._10N.261.45.C6]
MARIASLEKKGNFSVGMYQESGVHRESGFTYVSLFKYLCEGNSAMNLPARPALDLAFIYNPLSTSPMKKALTKYLSNIKVKHKNKDINEVMDEVGSFYRKEVYDIFGDESKIAANSFSTKMQKLEQGFDPNKPLIKTGSLRSKISYKNEHTGTIFEYTG